MFLKELLGRYERLVPQSIRVKREMIRFFADRPGFEFLSEDHIRYTSRVVYLDVHPLRKRSLISFKNDLLLCFRSKGIEVYDIR